MKMKLKLFIALSSCALAASAAKGQTGWAFLSPTNIIPLSAWSGSFAVCSASAFDSYTGQNDSVHAGGLPIPYPGVAISGVAQVQGYHFVLPSDLAIGTATISVNPNAAGGVQWGAQYFPAPDPSGPFAFEFITLHAAVVDPATVAVSPGDPITASFVPSSDLGVTFPNDPGAVYTSTFTASAQTDIPSFSSLF